MVHPEMQGDYWPLVATCVALGRLADAQRLLLAHDVMRRRSQPDVLSQPVIEQQHELLDALYMLLRTTPRYCRSGGDDVTGRAIDTMVEFAHYRATWLASVVALPTKYAQLFSRCEAVSPPTAAGVRRVLAVMAGDERTIAGAPGCGCTRAG